MGMLFIKTTTMIKVKYRLDFKTHKRQTIACQWAQAIVRLLWVQRGLPIVSFEEIPDLIVSGELHGEYCEHFDPVS